MKTKKPVYMPITNSILHGLSCIDVCLSVCLSVCLCVWCLATDGVGRDTLFAVATSSGGPKVKTSARRAGLGSRPASKYTALRRWAETILLPDQFLFRVSRTHRRPIPWAYTVQGHVQYQVYIQYQVYVVVVVLTLTHNSMQSVVVGQAPITLEWKEYLK